MKHMMRGKSGMAPVTEALRALDIQPAPGCLTIWPKPDRKAMEKAKMAYDRPGCARERLGAYREARKRSG